MIGVERSRDAVARVRTAANELRGDGRGWVLVVVAVGWALAIGVRLVFPALLPAVRRSFGMSLSTAGLLITVLWGAYASMQFPGGILADRYGERAVLVAAIALGGLGVVAVAAATTTVTFFLGTVGVGVGVGLYGTTRLTVLSDVFTDRTGTAIGIAQATGNVGTMALPPLAATIAAAVGWRLGFGALVPAFAVVAVALALVIPRRSGDADAPPVRPLWADVRAVGRALTTRALGLGTLCMILMMFVYQSFTGFYPTYLVVEKGLSESGAATILGLFFASAVVVQPIAGAARDRVGTRVTMTAILAGAVCALVALPLAESRAGILAVTLLASTQLAFWPIGNTYIVETVPDEAKGTGFGLVRTGFIGLGASGPVVVGALGDAGRFDAAFFLLAGVATVVLALGQVLPPVGR
ncbi:MFS transporter [Haloplanus rubicundus]|uniref:MFS transporter n=1 Tax=Haloplanus rubicundus TaxID=1547898 RepID=A0A345EB29_9EURY|nr:MFS transporter [Haloplanus rubicundus]AXG09401.1 MFS transporter [Haloplanus rubicundus]